ncbi:MAG: hypothetical protein ABSH35_09295 [Isosphaeraceae bacterium]
MAPISYVAQGLAARYSREMCGKGGVTRLSAPKRIGRPYRLAAFSTAPGFDTQAWLPGDVMATFFQAT